MRPAETGDTARDEMENTCPVRSATASMRTDKQEDQQQLQQSKPVKLTGSAHMLISHACGHLETRHCAAALTLITPDMNGKLNRGC
ncbi:hypothetical protein KOW79_015251 [Hemibagrus wyckioides]|uniref:Uncharacterized protein n=1 Tax=Hemibagrus wyckioides TaxID=337641 RepID=A0A9D3NDP1_9TELE|nr:hypothetical protein KOW79_015251 [Hemibagrus wyckioides]